MADGTAVADIKTISTGQRFGIDFRHVDSDTAQIEPLERSPEEEACVHPPGTYGDASVGSTLVLFDTKEPKPESWELVDVRYHLSQAAERLCDDIETTLREDREEGHLHGEVCATEAAVATCKRIACRIGPLAFLSLGLKWAAFGEDTGGVSLVLRSVATTRRVDFRISPDGLNISAVHIDENLEAKSVPLALDDRRSLRESAAWVHRQP